jgi:hypothetical protein
MLFAGFFVRIQQIPVYLRWAQYLCALKYCLNLILLTEFDNCEDGSNNPAMAKEACARLLEVNDVQRSGIHTWIYMHICTYIYIM